MNETIKLLSARRSAKPFMLAEPGPSPAQLETILTCAARVPDHKMVEPFRFVIFEGEARRAFGELLARVAQDEEPEPLSEVRLATERNRFLQAPLVIAVINSVRPTPGAPDYEQMLSCGAATFNLCVAANAMGFGTCWLTGWAAFSPGVGRALELAAGERVAGFVHIGTQRERQPERNRPSLDRIVSRWRV